MENELKHYGVLGMKWGIRRTAAQLGHKVGEYRRKKKQQVALEKARQARAEKVKRERAKNKALESGDPNEILKYKNDLTTDQLRAAYNKIQAINDLEKLKSSPTTQKGDDAVKKFLKESGKKILLDTTVDVGAQLFKYVLVDKVNKRVGAKDNDGKDMDVVFTNNKRK